MRFREVEKILLDDGWYEVGQKVPTTITNTPQSPEKSRFRSMQARTSIRISSGRYSNRRGFEKKGEESEISLRCGVYAV